MSDSPQKIAYSGSPPRSLSDLQILMRGGEWHAYDPLPLLDFSAALEIAPEKETMNIHRFAARRIRGEYYEIYSVETGEIVGHIN